MHGKRYQSFPDTWSDREGWVFSGRSHLLKDEPPPVKNTREELCQGSLMREDLRTLNDSISLLGAPHEQIERFCGNTTATCVGFS
jgi:hypothetical protein